MDAVRGPGGESACWPATRYMMKRKALRTTLNRILLLIAAAAPRQCGHTAETRATLPRWPEGIALPQLPNPLIPR